MRTILGILTALVTGGATALVLGCIEMLVLHEFRGVVAAILATVGLGAAVGWSTGWGARLWHLRDPRIVVLLGLLTAVLAELATFWVLAHLLEFGEEGRTVPVLVPLGDLSASETIAALRRAVSEGAWHWTRHYHVRGIALVVTWVVEAISLLGISASFALLAVRTRPYCESCRSWMRGPTRVGPFDLAYDTPEDETSEEELDLDETLRRFVVAPAEDQPPYLVDLWRCHCPDRATASIHVRRPGSKSETLAEHEPISREVHEVLLARHGEPTIATRPTSPIWFPTSGPPEAQVPDARSRWGRPCFHCDRKLATGFWEHVNGFAVVCPHCGETHSHPGEITLLLAITLFTGPLAFFLSMRISRALPAFLVVVAVFFAGRSWFAAHPAFALEVVFYVALLMGCVIFNAFAYTRQHAGKLRAG